MKPGLALAQWSRLDARAASQDQAGGAHLGCTVLVAAAGGPVLCAAAGGGLGWRGGAK